MVSVQGEGTKCWPRSRGPSGQALATGNSYVDKWSDTENVNSRKKKLEPDGTKKVAANHHFNNEPGKSETSMRAYNKVK